MWQDPAKPIEYQDEDQLPAIPPQSGGMPPVSSYGPMAPSWNKETMDLLVDIEIPKEILDHGENRKLLVWTKKILMQMQFGNYTAADQKKFIKDLQYIIFLSHQGGKQQIAIEAQLILVANLQLSKGRSDKPDGLRERVLWAMSIMKNIFTEEKAKRPEENRSILNLPFGRG
jgi:hypothetical protein